MNKVELYNKSLKAIEEYFGVSRICAGYLFHRAFRSRRRDEKHLEWNIQLQNAVVKADKCLGLEWDKVEFAKEQDEFSKHGIIIDEMDNSVFRWVSEEDDDDYKSPEEQSSEWTVVSRKRKKTSNRKKIRNIGLLKRPGLIVEDSYS
jgi:hypothetical protein